MEDAKDLIYEITETTEAAEATQAAEVPQEREAVSEGSSAPAEPLPESAEGKESEVHDDPHQSELDSILSEMAPEEALGLIRKGRAYDEDVAEAEVRGEIAGRNARIEQLLDSVAADRHPERNLSSGLPVGKTIRSIFDLADLA